MSVAFDPAPPLPGEEPVFPPLLSGERIPGDRDPLAKAIGAAAAGVDAGTVFWADREDRLDAAIVFAPEAPLRQALAMVYAVEIGLGDALGALAPPEVAVTWIWPDRVRVNGADAGILRVEASTRDPEAVPDWLAVAVTLQIEGLAEVHGAEPGTRPDLTSLREEGCAEISRTRLLESWSRHMLLWVHRWLSDGFRPLHDGWLPRADGVGESVRLGLGDGPREGVFLGLDEEGALLLRGGSGTEALSIAALLDAPRLWPPKDMFEPAAAPEGAAP